jgi:N utilization substance protein B
MSRRKLDDSPIARRHRARKSALQALYQWQMAANPMHQIIEQFRLEQSVDQIDDEYFERLAQGVAKDTEALDVLLATATERAIDQIDQIERAVLRMGALELRDCLETPVRVVLNEAVELAKIFGSGQGTGFVNAVLDKLAHDLRNAEIAAQRG